ncbi:uncharacterized protein LOC144861690 [Branchiostoma floridae x Branchiostoma japonicum]
MANCDDSDESNRYENEVLKVIREDNLLFTGREWTPLSALLRIQIERIRRRDFVVNYEDPENKTEQLVAPVTATKEETQSSGQATLIDEILSGLKRQLTGLIMEFEEVVGKFRERQRALYTQMRQERETRRVKEDELAAQLSDLDQNIVVLKDALLPTLSQGDASTMSHLQDQVTQAQRSARRLVSTAEQAAEAGLELSEGATLREGIVVLHNSVQKLGQALSEFGSVLTSTGHGTASQPVASLPPSLPPVSFTVVQPLACDLTDKSSEFEDEPKIFPARSPSLLPTGDTWKVIRDGEDDYIPPVHGPSVGSLGTLHDLDYHARNAETDSEVSQQKRYPYESALNRFWAKTHPGREESTETSLERASSPSGMESASKSSQRRSLVDVEAWLSTQESDACYADTGDDRSFKITSSAATPSGASTQHGTSTASTLGTLSDESASTYASGRSDVTGGFTPRSTKDDEPRTETPYDASRSESTRSSVKRELYFTPVESDKTAVTSPRASEPDGKVKLAATSSPDKQDVPSTSKQPHDDKRVSKRNSLVGLFPYTSLTPAEDRVQEKVRHSHRILPFSAFVSSTDLGKFPAQDKTAASPGGRVFPAPRTTEIRRGLEFGKRVAARSLQGKSLVPGTGASWVTRQESAEGRISYYLELARPMLKRSLVTSATVLSVGLLLVFFVMLFLPREVNLELRSTLSSYAASSHVFKVKNFGLPPT